MDDATSLRSPRRGLVRRRAAFAVLLGLGIACGARTPLDDPDPRFVGGIAVGSAGTNGAGGSSAGVDGGHDASDAGASDASLDAAKDVSVDVTKDVAVDAPQTTDAAPFDCVDAGITYIYLIASDNTLFSFYPPSGVFTSIGTIACNAAPGASPFSMGVDRHGFAYVLFTDGEIFLVDTATAACSSTAFVPSQNGFTTFGMAFSSDGDGIGETLYVAENPFTPNPPPSKGLGRIDIGTFELSVVGPFAPTPASSGIELTGTGAGKLFGFSLPASGFGGTILEIDKKTAKILSNTVLPVGPSQSALAFAFWGGSFYVFTTSQNGTGTGTDVNRYDPADGSVTLVLQNPSVDIVGAGVSTCAPD